MQAGTQGVSMGPVLVGVLVAAISGIIAIRWMIRVVSNKKLSGFSYYVWVLGVFVIVWGITH